MATRYPLSRKTSAPNFPSLHESPPGVPSSEVQSLPDTHHLTGPLTFSTPKRGNKNISVLILNPCWTFDTYGLSCISKSLIQNIRSVDSSSKNVQIYCAVLEEEGKIPQDQLKEAKTLGIQLIGWKQPRGKNRSPCLQWLDEDITKYYEDLLDKRQFDFIIGHIPIVANGVLNLKSVLCKRFDQKPKVIMVVHSLPMTANREADDDSLEDWLKEADMILSIGGTIWMEVCSFVKSRNIQVNHELYLPSVALGSTNLKEDVAKSKLSGEQNIVIMLPDGESFENSDLDFELAVVSSVHASQNLMFSEGSNLTRQLSFNLKVIASLHDEKSDLEETFKTLKENNKIQGSSPGLKIVIPKNIDKLKPHLKRATLLVLPLKADSHVFGSETLNALAAGIPILVSKKSGIASFLHDRGLKDPVVWDGEGLEKDVGKWKERMIQKIANPEEALRLAKELGELLKLDLQTACTHRNFISYMTGPFCVKLELKLDASPVEPQLVSEAVKKGVKLEKTDGPTDAVKYVTAYLQRLICGYHRTKIAPEIHAAWQQVLLLLEVQQRKVVKIDEDKLVITLYCPTPDSRTQLGYSSWIRNFMEQLEQLVQVLGVDGKPNLGRIEDQNLSTDEQYLLASSPAPKLRHSSGPVGSEGYETMTAASACLPGDSMFGHEIVDHWLFLRRNCSDLVSSAGEPRPDHPGLRYIETLNEALVHVPNMNSFAVSQRGTIGITSRSDLLEVEAEEGQTTIYRSPSLSVAYPGQKKPRFLSNSKEYWSAAFMGDDHLAAVCSDDNSIHLCDLANGTSKIVYCFKSTVKNRKILCSIDNRTVACRDASPSGENKVEILNTETEPWAMKTVLYVTSVKDIYNMASMWMEDATHCLLVCSPRDRCVQALEIIGGHVRWECNKSQMGELCGPLSACVDSENTVYVADYLQNKVHLIHGENGLVMQSVDVSRHKLLRPFYVCTLHEFLYVGHLDEAEEKPLISKFI